MKTIIYLTSALLAMSTMTTATPTNKGYKEYKDYKDCPDDKTTPPAPPKDVFHFDKTFYVVATPDQVVNGTGANSYSTPGQPGAQGIYQYGLNFAENVICYNITLTGVSGNYQSPARTATHIHQAVKGQGGPPRIALPNPEGTDQKRTSVGCLKGPFLTGILANGVDTGTGFQVSQIAENPAGFFTDSHTSMFVPGVVRGQFA